MWISHGQWRKSEVFFILLRIATNIAPPRVKDSGGPSYDELNVSNRPHGNIFDEFPAA
jgi:hypothetical protein